MEPNKFAIFCDNPLVHRHLQAMLLEAGFNWSSAYGTNLSCSEAVRDALAQNAETLYCHVKSSGECLMRPGNPPTGGHTMCSYKVIDSLEELESVLNRMNNKEWELGCHTLRMSDSGTLKVLDETGGVVRVVSYTTVKEVHDAVCEALGLRVYSDMLNALQQVTKAVTDEGYTLRGQLNKARDILCETGFIEGEHENE